MIKKIINKIRYINYNVYLIVVDSKDNYENNNLIMKIVGILRRKGIQANFIIVQGIFWLCCL